MTASDLLAQIDRTFPFVPRPSPGQIPAHADGCAHCEFTVRELLKYPGPELPDAAVRHLGDEFSALSARALAWVLPSYLRYVLTREDERDPRATEFLIYNLGPPPEYAEDTRRRLSLLTGEQVETLMALIRYLKGDERWTEYCGDELDRAEVFLRGLLGRPARE